MDTCTRDPFTSFEWFSSSFWQSAVADTCVCLSGSPGLGHDSGEVTAGFRECPTEGLVAARVDLARVMVKPEGCSKDEDCRPPEVCQESECVEVGKPGCTQDSDCPSPQTCSGATEGTGECKEK